MFPQYSSTVLIKYCTFKALWKNYRELLLEFYFIFTLLNSYSLFKLFKYPPVQTAIVHTVQHWQVFTKVEQRHPRHLIIIFFLFLHWEAAYTSAFLLPFTKVYKDAESLLTSGKSVFLSQMWEEWQLLCNLFRKSKSAWVTHSFLCHTLSFFSVFNFSSFLNLFLFLWLNQGVMTLWQLHKKAGFHVKWGQSRGSLHVCNCVHACVEVGNVWCIVRVTGGGVREGNMEHLKMIWLMAWLLRLDLIAIHDIKSAYNLNFSSSRTFVF